MPSSMFICTCPLYTSRSYFELFIVCQVTWCEKLWQATRLFGLGDEFSEDAMLGKLEGMKDVIEQVNRQFKDPVR